MIWRFIQIAVVFTGLGLLFAAIKGVANSGEFGNGLIIGAALGFGWAYLLYWLDKRKGYVIELTEDQRNERQRSSGF